VVAERRITDVAECANPVLALRARGEDYAPGDTDLAWTRITPWRSLLAGAFDTVDQPVVSARVAAPVDDPGAELLAGWLQARLGVVAERVEAVSTGIEAVTINLADGAELALIRQDGTAVLRRTGYADRVLALLQRRLGDELAEELRRLDPDQPYAAALSAASGLHGLDRRAAMRVHIWHDPALSEPPA
jgi:glucose-6-phosphate dehydrogenase assembly protein OpcA